jgi:hypothetical protein
MKDLKYIEYNLVKILGWTEFGIANKKKHQIKAKRLIKGKMIICH